MKTLSLNKAEIKRLLELEHIHDWMKYGCNDVELDPLDEQLSQKIYKIAYDSGLNDCVEYCKDCEEFETTDKFDDSMDEIIDRYDDFIEAESGLLEEEAKQILDDILFKPEEQNAIPPIANNVLQFEKNEPDEEKCPF